MTTLPLSVTPLEMLGDKPMTNFIRMDFEDFCKRSDHEPKLLQFIIDGLPKGAWLAGGAVRRVLAGHKLDSDFDFFFRDETAMIEWELALPSSMKLVRETKHHKHWRGALEGMENPIDVQAIKFAFYANAEAVIDSFDYTITMFALDGTDLVTTPEALWDLGRKRLAIHRVTYPVATMRRMLKYGKQGFTACAGCMATLFRETAKSPEALGALDIEYVD